MRDPLASWWVHDTQVRRFTGDSGGYGTDLADSATVRGFVHFGTKLVRTASGDQNVPDIWVAYPADTALIPPRSEITVPPELGGGTYKVTALNVADAGAQPTPNHIELALQ